MCYNWGLKFFNQEELKSHISENHEVGSYICPKCEEGYELGMKLKKHTQEGTEEDRVWIAQVVSMWRTLKRT